MLRFDGLARNKTARRRYYSLALVGVRQERHGKIPENSSGHTETIYTYDSLSAILYALVVLLVTQRDIAITAACCVCFLFKTHLPISAAMRHSCAYAIKFLAPKYTLPPATLIGSRDTSISLSRKYSIQSLEAIE